MDVAHAQRMGVSKTIRGLFSDGEGIREAGEAESGLRRIPAVELDDDLFSDLPTVVRDRAANDATTRGLADALEPAKPPPVPRVPSAPVPTVQRLARMVEPSRIDFDTVLMARGTLPPPTVDVAAPASLGALRMAARIALVAVIFGAAGFGVAHVATTRGERAAARQGAAAGAPAAGAPAAGVPAAGRDLGEARVVPASDVTADVVAPSDEALAPTTVDLDDVVIRVPRARGAAAADRATARAREAASRERAASDADRRERAARQGAQGAQGAARPTLSRDAVVDTLRAFEGVVRDCAVGHYGVASVRLVVLPSGRVTTATVTGGSVVGSPAGSCIARSLRAARFPAFTGDRAVVQYPFQL